MTLGGVIRTLRHSAGLSQKEFARRLDISPSYLSLIEGDKREASLPLLRSMAGALGAPATILFAAALGSQLAEQGKTDELTIIERLVEAVRLNLGQERLPFALQAGE